MTDPVRTATARPIVLDQKPARPTKTEGTPPQAVQTFSRLHPAVASIDVDARNGAQIDSNVERYLAAVPARLWREPHAPALLPAGYPTTDPTSQKAIN
ncbi:hypothetical protein [Microbacterium sp. HJ5]